VTTDASRDLRPLWRFRLSTAPCSAVAPLYVRAHGDVKFQEGALCLAAGACADFDTYFAWLSAMA
jgi:hypothetical protein